MNRDDALQQIAQRRADYHPQFWEHVRQIGTEQAAAEVWFPGHALSVEQIKAALDAKLATARAA